MLNAVLALAAAYLIGGIPFGYLIVKWRTGADVRAAGSGNIGATNVLRTPGRTAGIVTLLLDIAKGAMAVWLMDAVSRGNIYWIRAPPPPPPPAPPFPLLFTSTSL